MRVPGTDDAEVFLEKALGVAGLVSEGETLVIKREPSC